MDVNESRHDGCAWYVDDLRTSGNRHTRTWADRGDTITADDNGAVLYYFVALHGDDPRSAECDGPCRPITRYRDEYIQPVGLVRWLDSRLCRVRNSRRINSTDADWACRCTTSNNCVGATSTARRARSIHVLERVSSRGGMAHQRICEREVVREVRVAERVVKWPTVAAPAEELSADSRDSAHRHWCGRRLDDGYRRLCSHHRNVQKVDIHPDFGDCLRAVRRDENRLGRGRPRR